MTSSNKNILAAIFIIFGFLLRVVYVRYVNPIDQLIYSDMGNYIQIADQIMKDQWLVTQFFQPIGYPLLLVTLKFLSINWPQWLEWLQLVLSTFTLWVMWKTINESMGHKIALWSLGIASINLSWIAFTGFILSETVFIFLLSLLAWSTLRLIKNKSLGHSIIWSLLFFMAFQIKGTHVFLAPLFLAGLYYFNKSKSYKAIVGIGAILLIGLVGHGLFTLAKIDKFQLSASAGGLNFVEGKCPLKNNADSAGYSWLSPLYNQLGKDKQKKWDQPFTNSGFFMKEGLKCIIQNPLVMLQSLEGIPYLFIGNTLWPANQTRVHNLMRLFEVLFGCFAIVGIAAFLKFNTKSEEEILLWVLPVVSVFVCVYIFKSEIRFRIPFDVWIIPMSVKGWDYLMKARVS